jgi:hypothetical protein
LVDEWHYLPLFDLIDRPALIDRATQAQFLRDELLAVLLQRL